MPTRLYNLSYTAGIKCKILKDVRTLNTPVSIGLSILSGFRFEGDDNDRRTNKCLCTLTLPPLGFLDVDDTGGGGQCDPHPVNPI